MLLSLSFCVVLYSAISLASSRSVCTNWECRVESFSHISFSTDHIGTNALWREGERERGREGERERRREGERERGERGREGEREREREGERGEREGERERGEVEG